MMLFFRRRTTEADWASFVAFGTSEEPSGGGGGVGGSIGAGPRPTTAKKSTKSKAIDL